MSVGLGILRLSPRDFWAATPREIAAAVRGLTGGADASFLPARADLERMMLRYPDQ